MKKMEQIFPSRSLGQTTDGMGVTLDSTTGAVLREALSPSQQPAEALRRAHLRYSQEFCEDSGEFPDDLTIVRIDP